MRWDRPAAFFCDKTSLLLGGLNERSGVGPRLVLCGRCVSGLVPFFKKKKKKPRSSFKLTACLVRQSCLLTDESATLLHRRRDVVFKMTL